MTKLDSIIEDFGDAVNRLKDVLNQKKNEFIRDSAIQRFEIVFELAWKTTKVFLEENHNTVCLSPKTCFKDAYAHKLISYDVFWLKMADLRNATAHTYKEEMAENVYAQLPEALRHLELLLVKIKEDRNNL